MEAAELCLEWYQVKELIISNPEIKLDRVRTDATDFRFNLVLQVTTGGSGCHLALVNSEWLDNLRDGILLSGKKYLENLPGAGISLYPPENLSFILSGDACPLFSLPLKIERGSGGA